MLRSFLACSTLLFVPGHTLATKYVAETKYTVESKFELALETTEMTVERDGEPMEPRGGGGGSTVKRHSVWTDQVITAVDGKPTKLRRSFEGLEQTTTTKTGESEREVSADTPLLGLMLELELDEAGKIGVTVIDGSAPSEATLLEGHVLALQPDALLPAEPTEEGASWDLDQEAIRTVLGVDLQQKLFVRPQAGEAGAEGGGARGNRGGGGGRGNRIFDLAEWSGEAKLQGEEDVDGVACWVVALEIKGKGELPAPEMRAGGRRGEWLSATALARGNPFEIELAGDLKFAKAEHRPVALELTGSARLESNMESTRQESTLRIHSVQEGTLEYSIRVSPAAAAKEDAK
ncbi:MAG: hypothetical protein FJ299_03380 [Planctomycetes bacterium]|nr:hypothetical protein [Planctomycetota bacterium]